MKYDIKAIPTTYAGVNFRSRLEARWAAFFDLCGWKWDYEPFDLDGWAPDFMLKGKIKALVEVKPIDFSAVEEISMRQAQRLAAKAFRTAATIAPKQKAMEDMCDSDLTKFLDETQKPPQYEIMVVGNGPFRNDNWNGWGLGVFALDDLWDRDFADLFYGLTAPLDYAARYNNYQYRIGGQHDGDGHLHSIRHNDCPEQLWREAGNIVQWKPDNSNRRRRTAA